MSAGFTFPFPQCSWMASSGKSSDCSKLPPIENNKDHFPLGNIQLILTFIFVVFLRSVQ